MSLYIIVKRIYHRLLPQSLRQFIFRITPKPLKSLKGYIVRSLEKSAKHDEIYDEDYYIETYIKKQKENERSCSIIAQSIMESFHPETAVDVGCGAGFLLSALNTYGVHGRGLEYSDAGLNICRQRGLDVIKFDLENDVLPEGITSDVAISTEVAEHLPESCADRFVDILCAIANNVVFTAAQPSPKSNISRDHINEQPKEYWIHKFQAHGFVYNKELSAKWSTNWKTGNVLPWYVENIMIFCKSESTSS